MAATDRMIPLWGSQALLSLNGDNFAFFLDFSHDAWCFRDLNGHFIYVNNSFQYMANVDDDSYLIDKSIDSIKILTHCAKSNLIKLENKVINTKTSMITPIWGMPFCGYRNPIINIRIHPLFSFGDNRVIGTYWHCYVQRSIPLGKVVNKNYQFSDCKQSPYDFFSEKDWVIIWLFSHGWSHKNISNYLDIPVKTSRNIISNSYSKLSISGLDELHDMIITRGWDSEIPIFNKMLKQ